MEAQSEKKKKEEKKEKKKEKKKEANQTRKVIKEMHNQGTQMKTQ